jgi:hypothetical protein
MRGDVFSKNIWEGASQRRNENILVSGTLKMTNISRTYAKKVSFLGKLMITIYILLLIVGIIVLIKNSIKFK